MDNLKHYISLLKESINSNYVKMFREASGSLKYPYIAPGSASYNNQLWDWDSWWSDIALSQILKQKGDQDAIENSRKYQLGNVLNMIDYEQEGWIPLAITETTPVKRGEHFLTHNIHKPCLAQHVAFISKLDDNNVEWVREGFSRIMYFHNLYMNHFRHAQTGLFFWANDSGCGVDNDPSLYYRPPKSCGSIFLNSLMKKEFEAAAYIAEKLGFTDIPKQYLAWAQELKLAVQKHCYDPWLGFYYSVDFNLNPIDYNATQSQLHHGAPRDWDCLIMRIGSWSGFMAMWANIATPEQAQRMVTEHYLNSKSFYAPYGVRTLSKQEKMYNVRATSNPSSWLGPIWGISNYIVFKGLLNYGYKKEAVELAEKSVKLFGQDIERFGALHEYYEPESGQGVLNRGFQNWNYLVMNMIDYLENKNESSLFLV